MPVGMIRRAWSLAFENLSGRELAEAYRVAWFFRTAPGVRDEVKKSLSPSTPFPTP